MRYSIHVLSLILLSSIFSIAQVNQNELRFQKVDEHVSKVNKQLIFHPQLLSQKLSENLSNDYDKVRAFYVWIAINIDYDLMAYVHQTRTGQSINQVMRSGKALCSGFSLLFDYFCEEANIESVIIDGYAKGYGYSGNQRFKNVNHSWNAVKIYDTWYLLDVTWATGDPTKQIKHQKRVDLNTFFLSDPEEFVKTHLPEDPTWQLLSHKISLNEFELDEYQNNDDKPINAYSPFDYEKMNEYDVSILQMKRAKEFNHKNRLVDPYLSFAYLYKGISMTEEIWKMDYYQLIDTIDFLKKSFYAYMDSCKLIADKIDYNNIPYGKSIFINEINYQKGVINYELAVELFSKAMSIDIPVDQADSVTEKYFDLAKDHFELTNPKSIYLNDATEYLDLIADFRRRKTNWSSVD